jgi:hypothetical protein
VSVATLAINTNAGQNAPAVVALPSQPGQPPIQLPQSLTNAVGVTTTPSSNFQGTFSLSSPAPGGLWSYNIQAGMALTILDPPTKANPSPVPETVVVTGVSPATPTQPVPFFTANFLQPHAAGAQIFLYHFLGNPGPKQQYDPRMDTGVVTYFSVIQ